VRLASPASLVALSLLAGCNGCSKPQSGDPLPSGTSTSSVSTAAKVPDAGSVPHKPGGEAGVNLTHARTATPTTKGLPMIAITPKEIRFVGTKKEPIAMPPEISWYAGLPLSVKGDKQGLLILPIDGWLRELRGDAGKGGPRDLSFVVDNTISYRIVTEVLYTGAQAGFDRVHLVALTPDDTYGEIVLEMAGARPDAGVAPPFASLMVLPEGISIKTESNNVNSGCRGFGAGLAFARINGDIDTIGLPSCMDRITPEAGSSPDIVVGGSYETAFGEVISVIDGVRARKAKTSVHLGIQFGPPPMGPPPGINAPR
jgi:hypothetical protein